MRGKEHGHLPPNSNKAGRLFFPFDRVWIFRRGFGIDETEVFLLKSSLFASSIYLVATGLHDVGEN